MGDQREKELNEELEDLRAQSEEKNALIEKLQNDLLNADNSEEIEKELKKAQQTFDDTLRSIALKLVRLKSDVVKIQDELEDTEYDDMKADEDRVKASLPESFVSLIDQLLSETEYSVSEVGEIALTNLGTITTL